MTRTITSDVTARIDDAQVRPLLLLEVTIAGTTYYYVNRDSDFDSDGTTYERASFNVSEISRTKDGISQVTITVGNADKTGTDWLAANEVRGGTVSVKVVEQDYPNDPVEYFSGLIDSIPGVTREQFSVIVRGREDFFERIPKRTFSDKCSWVFKPNATAGGFSTVCPFGGSVSSTTWAGSTPYDKGNIVVPTTGGSVYYYAKNSGTSASSEPTWPTTNGQTVVDNGIEWFAFVLTQCGKTATDCRARNGSSAKFGGFLPWNLR